jgi:hypothetical protein
MADADIALDDHVADASISDADDMTPTRKRPSRRASYSSLARLTLDTASIHEVLPEDGARPRGPHTPSAEPGS